MKYTSFPRVHDNLLFLAWKLKTDTISMEIFFAESNLAILHSLRVGEKRNQILLNLYVISYFYIQ